MADIAGLDDKILHQQVNPLFVVPVGDDVPREINMLVETPMGSINKYEYHTPTGLLKLDRVLYEKLPYPVEYGAIPQTWDEDEDPLDVMCLVSYPTFPGCVISVRPIGVMMFNDTGERDDKILAVPTEDIRWKHVQTIDDLPEHARDEIGFFFERYKDLQFKYKGKTGEVILESWQGQARAFEIIEEARVRFAEKFPAQ